MGRRARRRGRSGVDTDGSAVAGSSQGGSILSGSSQGSRHKYRTSSQPRGDRQNAEPTISKLNVNFSHVGRPIGGYKLVLFYDCGVAEIGIAEFMSQLDSSLVQGMDDLQYG
jgi:hypothetical protein